MPLSAPAAFIYSRSRFQGDFHSPNIATGFVLFHVVLFNQIHVFNYVPAGKKKHSFLCARAGRVKVSSFYHLRLPRFHYLDETISFHMRTQSDKINLKGCRSDAFNWYVYSTKKFSAAWCLHLLDRQSIYIYIYIDR